MKPTTLVIVSIISFVVILIAIAIPQEKPTRSERKIRDYLMHNPETVLKIMENAVQYRKNQANQNQITALTNAKPFLTQTSPASIVHGEGDLTLVEFFDYQCPYCKTAWPALREALRQDGNVRVIYKEFPVLGEMSTLAAHAAIAAQKQNKYMTLHHALMTNPERLSENKIFAIAEKAGLDIHRLREDMKDPAITTAIEQNQQLARALSIMGTPTFILLNDNHIDINAGVQSQQELTAWFNALRDKN